MGTDAELCGELLRQFVLCRHRYLKAFEPVVRHEKDVRHVYEGAHSGERVVLDLLVQRVQKYLERTGSVLRKMLGKGVRNVSRPRRHFEL